MKKTLSVLAIATLTSLVSLTSYAGPVMDGILSSKSINYGARPNSIPYSKINERGGFEGYSHDVCNEIKKDIEKKHNVSLSVAKQEVAATTGILFVSNNTTQLMCGAASQTPERLKTTNFLIIDADPVVPAVASGTNLKSLEDLKGKAVALVKGTTGEATIARLNSEKNWGVKIVLVKDYPEAFMLIEQGRADAVVSNGVLLAGIMAKMPEGKFKLVPQVELSEPELIGIVYSKTDEAMIAQVRETEARIKSDGTLNRLHDKWFNEPIPSGGNLKMQWTDAQKKLVFAK